MKKAFHKVFSVAVKSYFSAAAASKVAFKRGARLKSGLICQKYHGLTANFGCEGDVDAPIAFVDGSYLVRDKNNCLVTFGFKPDDVDGKIDWYNAEDFLPCLVSSFSKGKVRYTIKNFADKVNIDGNDFELVYTRLTVENGGDVAVKAPKAPRILVPLNKGEKTVEAGKSAVMDFVVVADRFGGKYAYPTATRLWAEGSFDSHYGYMRDYWLRRLGDVCEITRLPDMRLADAYRAGFIYTHIIKDGDELHVGENGYDRVFDHDVIGILVSLLTVGDFANFKQYASHILMNVQYPDARWKYAWVFAVYLQKTGDIDYVRQKFSEIEKNTHTIADCRTDGGSGIMKRTNAIDSNGHWTTDNWSALTGLAAYKYICDALGNDEQSQWANAEYDSLLNACNERLGALTEKYSIDYLPISMDEPNELGARSNPADANWASMFLFGRWAWDGYLLGAHQQGAMLDFIDKTYEYGIKRRSAISDSEYNFGGYPHGYYSSSYNAGYAGAALRGDKYREMGIKAYLFMIEHSQSGPFSWWEGIDYPSDSSPWSIPHAAGGGGSCAHMWGQATATKVLMDSLLCEMFDGTLIVGRGIPREWCVEGSVIELKRFPVSNGGRAELHMQYKNGSWVVALTGDVDGRKIILP